MQYVASCLYEATYLKMSKTGSFSLREKVRMRGKAKVLLIVGTYFIASVIQPPPAPIPST